MDVLSSRVLLRSPDLSASVRWFRDVLGLHVAREFGIGGRVTGVVFFLGGGFLEVADGSPADRDDPPPGGPGADLWLQVADVDAEHRRLAAAEVEVLQPPETKPWGLRECWIAAPDGPRIALVQVPDAHPLRRRVD